MSRAFNALGLPRGISLHIHVSLAIREKIVRVTVPSVTPAACDQNLNGEGEPSNIYFVRARLGEGPSPILAWWAADCLPLSPRCPGGPGRGG